MHWANAGTTATELRDKNALRFFVGSGMRIDHVIRSHSTLPFSSHSLALAPSEDVPRAVILLDIISSYMCSLQFSIFSFGGLSIQSNFSTSAAICALGERGDNRNRVTG